VSKLTTFYDSSTRRAAPRWMALMRDGLADDVPGLEAPTILEKVRWILMKMVIYPALRLGSHSGTSISTTVVAHCSRAPSSIFNIFLCCCFEKRWRTASFPMSLSNTNGYNTSRLIVIILPAYASFSPEKQIFDHCDTTRQPVSGFIRLLTMGLNENQTHLTLFDLFRSSTATFYPSWMGYCQR
jgi:hypothetical protein